MEKIVAWIFVGFCCAGLAFGFAKFAQKVPSASEVKILCPRVSDE